MSITPVTLVRAGVPGKSKDFTSDGGFMVNHGHGRERKAVR